MAIAARLASSVTMNAVMVPTQRWEWNDIRDGDLQAGRVAVIMVENYVPEDQWRTDGDTPVVIDKVDAQNPGIVQAAMALVASVMGTRSVAASFCHTAGEYGAYRATQTKDYGSGIQRRLKLPVEPDTL